MPRRSARSVVIGLLAFLLIPIMGTAASAADQSFTYYNWPTNAPAYFFTEYDPNSVDECASGKTACVDKVIREMRKRFKPLATSCSHNAPFALSYLRMTQSYRWSIDQAGYYDDVPWFNNFDGVFASYYLKAYDDWVAGRPVTRAWQIAFDAAKNREVTGAGNLMLGMNAHILRDLAYATADVGLVDADGKSRKPDFDAVNNFLATATEPMIAENTLRFDPHMDDATTPYYGSYQFFYEFVAGTRESAWRYAEMLVNARTPAERALVEAQIDNAAAEQALQIKLNTSYSNPLMRPFFGTAAERDAHCKEHFDDAPPMSYSFGDATAF